MGLHGLLLKYQTCVSSVCWGVLAPLRTKHQTHGPTDALRPCAARLCSTSRALSPGSVRLPGLRLKLMCRPSTDTLLTSSCRTRRTNSENGTLITRVSLSPSPRRPPMGHRRMRKNSMTRLNSSRTGCCILLLLLEPLPLLPLLLLSHANGFQLLLLLLVEGGGRGAGGGATCCVVLLGLLLLPVLLLLGSPSSLPAMALLALLLPLPKLLLLLLACPAAEPVLLLSLAALHTWPAVLLRARGPPGKGCLREASRSCMT